MTPERPNEQELIHAIARGDTTAFETLYHANKDFVFRVARRFSGDDHLALDAAQEVFAWLHQRCGRGDLHLTGRLSTLLYAVARNTAVSSLRRTRRESPAPVPERAAPEPRVDDASGLQAVLDLLPEERREVLLLRFVEGLSLLEIAAAMDIPTGTVKSRLHHALAALRDDPRTRNLLS